MARIGKTGILANSVRPMPDNIPCTSNLKSTLDSNHSSETNPFRNDSFTPIVVAVHRKNEIISSPQSIRESQKRRLCCTNCDQFRCNCLHVEFLKRTSGFLKIWEAVLGTICMYLLLEYGATYASRIGGSYTEFLISVSASLIPTILLIVCYICSKKTHHLLRASNFVS